MRALVWSLWERPLTTAASCLQNPSRRSALEDSSWNDAVNSWGHQPGHLRGIVLKLSAHWLPTLHTTQHPCLVTSKRAQQTVPAHENENSFISQQTLHWVWYACSSIIGGYIYLTWAYSFCEKKKKSFEFCCFCSIQGCHADPHTLSWLQQWPPLGTALFLLEKSPPLAPMHYPCSYFSPGQLLHPPLP